MRSLSELKELLTPDNIIAILAKYDVHPVTNRGNYIIFPTACHNLHGGSPKLYYYKDSCLFKCYTECDGVFDIFTLLIKMEKLRGHDINAYQAATICGISTIDFQEDTVDLGFMETLFNRSFDIQSVAAIDKQVLERYIFQPDVMSLWEQEGISLRTMHKYKIAYDPIANCITIPIFDQDGNLVSIRGRYLAEDADAKYKPVTYGNKILSSPSSLTLYGFNETRQAIQESKRAIIFEGEKSVLMMDSYYGNKNNSVATLGKNISMQHIMLLQQAGVQEVVLAYDADYRTHNEIITKYKEYTDIARRLAPFFDVSIIFDTEKLLPYKASPIDCGKEIFEQLMEKRWYVRL